MHNEDQESKLLAETFHGDWEAGRTSELARRAAASARRHRRARRTLAASTAAALIALGLWLAQRAPRAALPASPEKTVVARGYEIISDEELLAQLRDRALLAVRKENGAREFVLLQE